MTWDKPPTVAGQYRYYWPPVAKVERSGGPERVAADATDPAPPRRYVGFVDPAGVDVDEQKGTGTFPGVW